MRDIYAVNYYDVSNFTKCLRFVCDFFFRDINPIKILFLVFKIVPVLILKSLSLLYFYEIKNPTAINKIVKY